MGYITAASGKRTMYHIIRGMTSGLLFQNPLKTFVATTLQWTILWCRWSQGDGVRTILSSVTPQSTNVPLFSQAYLPPPTCSSFRVDPGRCCSSIGQSLPSMGDQWPTANLLGVLLSRDISHRPPPSGPRPGLSGPDWRTVVFSDSATCCAGHLVADEKKWKETINLLQQKAAGLTVE